jgi:protein gp37
MGSRRYQTDGHPVTSGPGFGLQLHHDLVDAPRHWRKPAVVFVNSMSDLFHERIPFDFLQRVFATMEATPQHTYQVLTKRATHLTRVAPGLAWPPNVWMGVTVENQAAVRTRARRLLEVPAAVRFLSVEPLIESVVLDSVLYQPRDGCASPHSAIHWVIAGGESGPRARRCELDWLRDVRDQCRLAGVPYFLKQLGGWPDKRGHEKALLDGERWLEMPTNA